MAAQDRAMNDPTLQMGDKGPANVDHGPHAVWCNQGVMRIIREAGGDVDSLLVERGSGYTSANDIAEKLSDIQKLPPSERTWHKINEKPAQRDADMGYPVIAIWPNPNGSGHVATLRPFGKYTEEDGPSVANVGKKNKIGSTRVYFGVGTVGGPKSMDEIHYYSSAPQPR